MAIELDFHGRQYTAEVLRARSDAADLAERVSRLSEGETTTEVRWIEGVDGQVTLSHFHYRSAAERPFSRGTRTVLVGGRQVAVPRSSGSGRAARYVYDVLVAWCGHLVLVAVPFHRLAQEFFLRADSALAGTNTLYQKLDITELVIALGAGGSLEVDEPPTDQSDRKRSSHGGSVTLNLSRCHLSYSDPDSRTRSLQQVAMTGEGLGDSDVYRWLIGPVLNPPAAGLKITPILLGFGLSAAGVKKASATTDRHGNFKVWVSPSLRGVAKVFRLLQAIERLSKVVSPTPNIPILQSGTIAASE